jgi:adenylate cyclase, class 2
MNIEFEAKAIKIDKGKIRAKLEELGAELVFAEREFTRITFDNPTLKKNNAWIRLRDEGKGKVTLTFKVISDENSIEGMHEVGFEVSDMNAAMVFVEQLGFERKGYEKNLREEWKLGDVIFDIDTWPLIDPYLEIEASSEEQVKKYFEMLDLNYADASFGSADILYRDVYGIEILGRESLTFEDTV